MAFTSLHHSFDIQLAATHGVEEAILIHHFQHWISINQRKGINKHDGRTWTYQTREEIAYNFPYWDSDKVRRLTDKLVDMKVIIKANYNKCKFDKTIWYAFVNEEMFTIGKIAKSTDENVAGEDENVTPIPDTNKADTKEPLSKDKGSSERKKPLKSKIKYIDGQWEGIEDKDKEVWLIAYPGIDLTKELARMVQWLKANPKRSHKTNWLKFITNWLTSASDRKTSQDAIRGSYSNDRNQKTDRRTKDIKGDPVDSPVDGRF